MRPAPPPAPTLLLLGVLVAVPLVTCGKAFGFTAPYYTENIFSVDPGQFGVRGVTTYNLRQGNVSVALPQTEMFYRFTDSLELDLKVPFELDVGNSAHYGYGSTVLVLNYRFYDGGSEWWTPSVGGEAQLLLPAIPPGPDHNIGTGYVHAYLPLIMENKFGPWDFTGNLALGINPGQGNRNYGFAGMSLTNAITKVIRMGGEIFYQSPPRTGLKDEIGFTLGAKIKIGKSHQIYLGVGRGLLNGRNADEIHTYAAYQMNF